MMVAREKIQYVNDYNTEQHGGRAHGVATALRVQLHGERPRPVAGGRAW